MAKKLLLMLAVLWSSLSLGAQVEEVRTLRDEGGWKLQVDGFDFQVKGMVWAYTPIGENYTYDLWSQPEDFITRMIDTDMKLMREMGVNTLRVFSTVPPRWIEYIYDNYGIYTMVNDLFGRYGITVNGRWQFPTDYSDPDTRRTLLAQARKTYETYKDTRGVLMYMLGNESNYGLEWTSTAIENLPTGEQMAYKAEALYTLFEEAIVLGKSMDPLRPHGLVNGDLQYLKLIAEKVPSLDILGVNTYRGPKSYGSFYESIARDLDKPFVYTELGADAFNVVTGLEDQDAQARLLVSQWQEIYEQSHGKGKSANCLGGYVFEWIDEWWKGGMEVGLDTHDTAATWNNGGYTFDSVPGLNNMNEEWFGVLGQSLNQDGGIHRRLPRAAYYLLKDLWMLDMYTSTYEEIQTSVAALDLNSAVLKGTLLQKGDPTTDPAPSWKPHGQITARTFWKGDDDSLSREGPSGFKAVSQATVKTGLSYRSPWGVQGSLTLRVLPPELANRDAEDLSRPWESVTAMVPDTAKVINSVELYQASLKYRTPELTADFHYHDGHGDWVMEGDFFGLLPEAWDIANPDSESSRVPFGVEVTLPQALPGLKIYAGPELYWGAQPRVMAKYYRTFGDWSLSLLHDQELGLNTDAATSAEKAADLWTSAAFSWQIPRKIRVEAGVLLGQYNRTYDPDRFYTRLDGNILYKNRTFTLMDSLAGKMRLTSEALPYLKLTGQYLYSGLLADSRGSIPREGSQIYDVGTGNRQEARGTAQMTYGDFVLALTGLWRQPLASPLGALGTIPRNPLDQDFTVWENREALQGEAVLTWDRTGATYFHDWNNSDREESPLSASLGLLWNFRLGATDIGTYKTAAGAVAKFSRGLPEVEGTWSLLARVAGRPFPGIRTVLTASAGKLQSTGERAELAEFLKAEGKLAWGRFLLEGSWAKDAWGPLGWHREFNLTYPLQWSAGVAWGLKPLSFLGDADRIGFRVTARELGSNGTDAEKLSGLKMRYAAELYTGFNF